MSTIGDRIEMIRGRLGGRSDIDGKIAGWLRDAYFELGMGWPFEELEDTYIGATVVGAPDYPYPVTDPVFGSATTGCDARAVKALSLVDSFNNSFPLYKRNIKYLDRYNIATRGRPSVFAPYRRKVILRLIPDQIYTLKWRVWIKPLISGNLTDTPILLPEDWLEVLDYGAALRGHVFLAEDEKANAIQKLLQGFEDPRSGRRTPGLIKQKLLLRQAEAENEEYGIQPRMRKYTG